MHLQRCTVAPGLCALLLGVSGALGGDVVPPMGPVEATMKSLEAIEPRLLVGDQLGNAGAVHEITRPGQYVLTEDISVPAGKSGIVVEVPPGVEGVVTIDFNGFTIAGQPGSLHAVHCKSAGARRSYNMMSAFPCNFRTMGGSGIVVDAASSVIINGVRVTDCDGDGLHIEGASSVEVVNWRDDDCDGDGIEIVAGPLSAPNVQITRSVSANAGANGMRIECRIGRIELARCIGASLHGMDIECDSMEMSDCTTSNNGQCGARMRMGKDMLQWRCQSNDNGWQGTLLLPAPGAAQERIRQKSCSAAHNGFGLPGAGAGIECSGISSVSMEDVECYANAGSGIVVADLDHDGLLDRITCGSNGGHGVHVISTQGLPSGRVTARDVLCDGNTSNGLFLEGTAGGEVSQCVGSNNGGVGIFVIGSGHVVRSNSVFSNVGAPIVVSATGNIIGPLVDELGVAGNCNPAANYVH